MDGSSFAGSFRQPEVRPSSWVAAPAPWRRRPAVPLSKRAIQWMAKLPAHVRPTEVAVRFPHVANNLAEAWPSEARFCEYVDSLAGDGRGGRRGFPADVSFELVVLKKHYDYLRRRARHTAARSMIGG